MVTKAVLWKFRWPIAILIAAFAGLVIGRACSNWNEEQKEETKTYTPEPAKEVAKAPTVVAEIPVATIQPTSKQRDKIAKRHNRPLGRSLTKEEQKLTGSELRKALEEAGEQVVSDVDVRPSTTPQNVLTTVNPVTGAVTTTVSPDKRRWLGLRGTWEIGGEIYRTLPADPDRQLDGRAWVAAYPVRLGHWSVGGFVGGDSTRGGVALYGLRAVRHP